ncbi:hypothetical protein [Pelosinus propionicus]|uniref:Uncharacterized protein n=1 Tax=Pelosinus propionicus DSM 13327 TaxID=1123291 RepID=A0A1I4JGS2_9FIRM|nr:hypothetical protein [Pelosinus propionicus]SFL65769.1 hypothetical protein SAMN04490355_101276 [Pelosinus propionicus DSM 13327]
MKIIDRNSVTYEVTPPIVKDSMAITQLLPKVIDMLAVTQQLEDKGISYGSRTYTLDEQYSALVEMLSIVTKGSNVEAFDISMARKVILHVLGLDKPPMPPLPILASLDRAGALDKIIKANKGDVATMEKEITTGTPIIDRNGDSHIAYSYLIKDFQVAMELLEKVNVFNMLENHDKESYEAMIKIVYLALNKRYTEKKLLKFVDAEFIQKAIRCYYGLPQVS